MIKIEALCEDDAFNESLLMLSKKNLLPFDDFRQEVFLALAESPHSNVEKTSKRIAMQMKRRAMKLNEVSIEEYTGVLSDERFPSVLWEDRHPIGGMLAVV